MRASKENVRKAIVAVDRQRQIPTTTKNFILDLLRAVEKKVPSDAAFDAEANRRKVKRNARFVAIAICLAASTVIADDNEIVTAVVKIHSRQALLKVREIQTHLDFERQWAAGKRDWGYGWLPGVLEATQSQSQSRGGHDSLIDLMIAQTNERATVAAAQAKSRAKAFQYKPPVYQPAPIQTYEIPSYVPRPVPAIPERPPTYNLTPTYGFGIPDYSRPGYILQPQ